MGIKLNEPTTPEEHEEADREYQRIVSNQKAWLEDIIRRLRSPIEKRKWENKAKHARTDEEKAIYEAKAASIIVEEPIREGIDGDMDRIFIAAVLRQQVHSFPAKRPRNSGAAKKVREDELLAWQNLIMQGLTKEAAYQEIADLRGVDAETAKKAILRMIKKKKKEGCTTYRLCGSTGWGETELDPNPIGKIQHKKRD